MSNLSIPIGFDLNDSQRGELWSQMIETLESYYDNTESHSVGRHVERSIVRSFSNQTPLDGSLTFSEAVEHVAEGLRNYAVHTPHPKYFGLFNPRPNFPSILADTMTATFNPQLAAWSHSPFAAEIETRMIREFGTRFGYPSHSAFGTFTSGGTEANLTALLCALNHRFPDFACSGLQGTSGKIAVYCSTEAHHSIHRATRTAGLGSDCIREIATDAQLRMDVRCLEAVIREDVQKGVTPLMIVATAGTTGSGAIDQLEVIGALSAQYATWFHVDAAYGGGAILSAQLKTQLQGIGQSDSITFDAHKWMSVPMATSMFLTSHREILGKTFSISTDYMPSDAATLGVEDPYSHSIQWSRRFIGLKVYLSLLFFGWKGFEDVVDHQTALANELRKELQLEGWQIENESALPIVCFSHDSIPNFETAENLLQEVYAQNAGWISSYSIHGKACLRACITNYKTDPSHIREFVSQISEIRDQLESEKAQSLSE